MAPLRLDTTGCGDGACFGNDTVDVPITSPTESKEMGVPEMVMAWPLGVMVLSATTTGSGCKVNDWPGAADALWI